MSIAIFGGSGAMGTALIDVLKENNKVISTSRQFHANEENVTWLQGDCHDDAFINSVLRYKPDCIVDFMIYGSEEFKRRKDVYLNNTGHYVFTSSSRVYAKDDKPMDENSARLLDTIEDIEYLRTDEYALAKARQEDMLVNGPQSNYTIVRPFLTYNFNRLQLGTYEWQFWLLRALRQEPILLPKQILDAKATMTYAVDVARRIACLLGREESFRKVVLPASPESHTWKDITEIYRKILHRCFGVDLDIRVIDSWECISDFFNNKYQLMYARAFDRMCNPQKTDSLCKELIPDFDSSFTPLEEGLSICVEKWKNKCWDKRLFRNQWDVYCDTFLRKENTYRDMDEKSYSIERNTQILIYLMKQHGIRRVIISPGTTNMNFALSVQNDDFFKVINVVDERSAAYMACGLAEETGEPVAISCTQATAPRGYIPGMTEAYYRKLPVLAIASTHRMGHVGHNIPQVTDRHLLQADAAVYHAIIPVVHDDDDEWSCGIKVNEALLALSHNGGGPVYLDLETDYSQDFSSRKLVPIKTINRICNKADIPTISAKGVVVYCGAHSVWDDELIQLVDEFCEKYNAFVLCDHMSNYHGKYGILPTLIYNQENVCQPAAFELVIHIGNVCRSFYSLKAENVWRVNPDGKICDTFRALTHVFEMDEKNFFRACNEHSHVVQKQGETCCSNYAHWYEWYCSLLRDVPKLPLSSVLVAKYMAENLKEDSVLHLCGSYLSKCFSLFEFKNIVNAYANSGGCGIDGPMSSFVGASLSDPKKLFIGVIGDLAFFYDMNCLGIRELGKNIRIIMVNNGCGMEMAQYVHPVGRRGDEACENLAAKGGHYSGKSKNLVRDYVCNLGFDYYRVEDESELASVSSILTDNAIEKPLFVEVFTNAAIENEALKAMYSVAAGKATSGTEKRPLSHELMLPKRLMGNDRKFKVVLWGAGDYFRRYGNDVRKKVSVEYVCDNNRSLWGAKIAEGITCISPDELTKLENVFVVIMIYDANIGFQIANQLEDLGIRNFDLVGNFLNYADYNIFT